MQRVVLSLVLILSFACIITSSSRLFSSSHYQSEFSSFQREYSKSYVTDELLKRFNIFQDNYDWIHRHNIYNREKNIHYTVAVNQFADLTNEEFKLKYASGLKPRSSSLSLPLSLSQQQLKHKIQTIVKSHSYPPSIDWRNKNVVLPVFDQGQCGSSPFFSASDPLASAWAIAKNILIPLSVQQLVDCTTVDAGCNGGFMADAYDYVISNKGICDNSSYPYTALTGKCVANKCDNVAYLDSYLTLTAGDETELVGYLNVGPAASAMDASTQSFQFYSGGVWNDSTCSTTPDHGIAIVGYGIDTTVNEPYWLLKNTWTTTWGEKGFARIARGSDLCGIAQVTNLPLISTN